ncbi:hypothetical protein TRIUR3_34107 [Triticum urartu]|uniref:Uncharacterized protein n=2 Tax=Triticum urartu TaxID=4572 RepID=M7ZAT4_TRIUA|nr:hypothetical protein TRIUR3_34107 [Triticum urartu]
MVQQAWQAAGAAVKAKGTSSDDDLIRHQQRDTSPLAIFGRINSSFGFIARFCPCYAYCSYMALQGYGWSALFRRSSIFFVACAFRSIRFCLFSEMDDDERCNRKFRAELYTLQWEWHDNTKNVFMSKNGSIINFQNVSIEFFPSISYLLSTSRKSVEKVSQKLKSSFNMVSYLLTYHVKREDLKPYLGEEDELSSRMTSFQEGEDDEDINTIVTPTAPAVIHTEPITRARAHQLNYQVFSFLDNDSNVHENMMLPKLDIFVLLTNEVPSLDKKDEP